MAFPEVRNRKGTESGLGIPGKLKQILRKGERQIKECEGVHKRAEYDFYYIDSMAIGILCGKTDITRPEVWPFVQKNTVHLRFECLLLRK